MVSAQLSFDLKLGEREGLLRFRLEKEYNRSCVEVGETTVKSAVRCSLQTMKHNCPACIHHTPREKQSVHRKVRWIKQT